jgi:RNA polymerase sigma factor (sigma-70 family)
MTTEVVISGTPVKNVHQELIEGCKSGDQKAQFQIYRLYYKPMYNSSFRIVNDKSVAEDIMQESFLSAFEKIDTYSGCVSFSTWLKRIVINRSLDALKKKSKICFEDIDAYPETLIEGTDDMFPDDEYSVTMETIREAIKRLPDKSRIILSLFLIEGYDHDEISEILSISGSISRSQFSSAKQRLIKELSEKKVSFNFA